MLVCASPENCQDDKKKDKLAAAKARTSHKQRTSSMRESNRGQYPTKLAQAKNKAANGGSLAHMTPSTNVDEEIKTAQ